MTRITLARPRSLAALLGSIAIFVLAVAPSFAHNPSRDSAPQAAPVTTQAEDTGQEVDEREADATETDEVEEAETPEAVEDRDEGPGADVRHQAVAESEGDQGEDADEDDQGEDADEDEDEGHDGSGDEDDGGSGEHDDGESGGDD